MTFPPNLTPILNDWDSLKVKYTDQSLSTRDWIVACELLKIGWDENAVFTVIHDLRVPDVGETQALNKARRVVNKALVDKLVQAEREAREASRLLFHLSEGKSSDQLQRETKQMLETTEVTIIDEDTDLPVTITVELDPQAAFDAEFKERWDKPPETVLPLTDLGVAERFIWRFGDITMYCPETKSWFTWNGRGWMEDVGGEIARNPRKRVGKSVSAETAKCWGP